ncbi:SRPBCC family protein [Nocardia puris]|uniref:Polyketide cyclase/dehydrase/lipid transport protein n=1 Tax=Nocardia puris TaxID=208602 RepID=A0A366DNQ9_9NOCA|nr:SRPBCC family protein [Nocardia puris]MBF6214190.1 SRPBCC family protein [Nocardia puris]MBF6365320.1 SRPBCC family protein [Nocardia puris]MBF6459722.1 SRPBCC family protein [Nocardia puris]RBO91733.1 polyketide cyclase/dehydrase/lipid transport protein [Nocardia puris]
MTEVKIVADCAASAESAFEYVNDYRNLPNYFHGIQSFTPVTEQTEGVGAAFDGHMKLGPASLHSRVEVVRWEKNFAIAIKSIKGFEIESTFLFHPKTDALSTVDAIVDYRVPGGLAGKALGRTIEPFVKIAVKHTTDNLIKQIAEFHAARG